jgi:hypothetical protein
VWRQWRRPDWLGELQAVLIMGLVVIGGFGILRAADALRGGALTVDVPASQVTGQVDHQLRDGAGVAPDQDLEVVVADPDLAQRLTDALTYAPSYLVVMAILVLLLRLVRRARSTDPFTRATVRQLRVLAVVAIAGGYSAFLVEMIAAMHLTSLVVTDSVFATVQVPLHWFLIGFGLFAIAEVVRRGCAMREDLDTVV